MKILLIDIDTLRADHLGCYGYGINTSPNIDRLSQDGVVCLNAFAAGIPTTPSHTSIFTGLHSITHRIVAHGSDSIIDPDIPLLPEILRDNGYRTAAVDNLYNVKPWFARGYEYYINPKSKSLHHIRAEEITYEAINWLKAHYNEDFFLFLHYWDPHSPYLPPDRYKDIFYRGKDPFDPDNKSMEPARKQIPYPFFKRWHYDLLGNPTDADYIIAQYDGEIRYVDDSIGELLEYLRSLGIYEDTLIILTSDHGENMTEHNFFFDHQGLYDNTIHIPLIIKIEDKFRGRKISPLVQNIDIMPTILELLDMEKDIKTDGQSLIPLINSECEYLYREIISTECTWRAGISIRTEGWKFIKTIDQGLYEKPSRELYNLKDDPDEEVSLADKEKDVLDELELRLTRWLDSKLKNKPNPITIQTEKGIPAKKWVENVLKDLHLTWDDWVEKQRFI